MLINKWLIKSEHHYVWCFLVEGSKSSGLGSEAPEPRDLQGSGDGDGEHGGGAPPGGSLNQQIVVALARLQEDMQSVLERLHTLEALTATQVRDIDQID